MATRTIQTGDDVEAAFAFLAKESNSTGDKYFMDLIAAISTKALEEADSKRFELVKQLLDEKNKGKSISDLRTLLGA